MGSRIKSKDAKSLNGKVISETAPNNNQVLKYNSSTGKWEPNDPSGGGGADTNAVHVNEPSEISGISAKGTPTNSDILLIEDVSDNNNKKKITIGSLPSSSGSSPLTLKGDLYTRGASADERLPVGSDGKVLVADSTELTGLKYVNLSETPAVGGGLLVDLGMLNVNQSITVGAGATTINFDSTVTGAINTNGDWNNTTKKFKVSTASGSGTYQFEVGLFAENTTASYYNLQAFVNGVIKTPNGAFAMADALSDSSWDGVAGTLSLDLNVNDEVEIKLQSYQATTVIRANGTWNFVQGMRISKTSGIKGDKGDPGTGAPVSLTKTFTLQEPVSGDNITIFRAEVDITIVEVIGVLYGSNNQVSYQLKFDAGRNQSGTAITASDNINSQVGGDTATITTANVSAGSWVWAEFTNPSTATANQYVTIDIRYTE